MATLTTNPARDLRRPRAWISALAGPAVALAAILAACTPPLPEPAPESPMPPVTVEPGGLGDPGGSVAAALPCAPGGDAVPPPPGLRAWWPMDGARPSFESMALTAGSQGPFEAELAGVRNWAWPMPDDASGPMVVAGVVGPALEFDGTGQHMRVADHSELRFFEEAELGFTIEAWIRPESVSGLQPIASKETAPADAPFGWRFFLQDGRLGLALQPIGEEATIGLAQTALPTAGAWHFVAATVERAAGATGTGRLFVDGQEVASFQVPASLGTLEHPGDLQLGHRGSLGFGMSPRFFTGAIDELALYDRALTAEEVGNLFRACAAGKAKPRLYTAQVGVGESLGSGADAGSGSGESFKRAQPEPVLTPMGSVEVVNVEAVNCAPTPGPGTPTAASDALAFVFTLSEVDTAPPMQAVNVTNYPFDEVFESGCTSLQPPMIANHGDCNPFTPPQAVPDYDDGQRTVRLVWHTDGNNAMPNGVVRPDEKAHFGYTIVDAQSPEPTPQAPHQAHWAYYDGPDPSSANLLCETDLGAQVLVQPDDGETLDRADSAGGELSRVNTRGLPTRATGIVSGPTAVPSGKLLRLRYQGPAGAALPVSVAVVSRPFVLADLVSGSPIARMAEPIEGIAFDRSGAAELVLPLPQGTWGVVAILEWPRGGGPAGAPGDRVFHGIVLNDAAAPTPAP